MILQALKEYYDRKARDSGIAPLGWEWKRIPFLVVFNANGDFVRLEDTRGNVNGLVQAKPFLVPSLGEAKGNGIKSNLFWENAEYFFGVPVDAEKLTTKGEKYKARVAEQHAEFIKKIKALSVHFGSNADYLSAVRFVERDQVGRIKADPLWEEALQVNQSFLMCLADKGPVPVIPEIKQTLLKRQNQRQESANLIRCLVTGDIDEPSRLEPDIKGVRNANPTGAHLVAVNNKITGSGNGGATPAFASFMKEQGANSPIGKHASLSYTTALNSLLSRDSRQKISIGDATVVFWSERKTTLEDEFLDLLDDPDKGVAAVGRLLASVRTGSFSHEDDTTRFYVLGLAPNSARISVRFWHNGTIAEMERRFADWFENLRIVHGPNDKEHLSLMKLLLSIAQHNKDIEKWKKNIPPNLSGAVMRSILEGTPYPATLLSSALVRIRAERDVTYARAKLIKAFLIRNHKRNITMNINKTNPSVGESLGQLFAMLEKIQLAANPGINATIRDKFYASASATPAAVFGNLMRLSGHHLSKLDSDKKGLRIWLEKRVEEIMSNINVFPPHLSLEEQGMFAIGYYHQRSAKKVDAESPDATKAL